MPLRTLSFIANHPLSSKAPIRSIGRYFWWQFRSRLSRSIEYPWIEGLSLFVERGMTGATGNVYCGLHEFSDMAFVLHVLQGGDLFLDVGANVGSYTVLASGVRKAKTIAFEPDPETARHLRRNVVGNGLEAAVTLHEVALGPSDGCSLFTTGKDTMNRVAEPADTSVREVPMRRLDGIAGANGAALMKLDVEGFESHVLAGADSVLDSRTLLAVETEGQERSVVERLESHGFSRAWYDPFVRQLSDRPNKMRSSNALFVRRQKTILERVNASPRLEVLGVSF